MNNNLLNAAQNFRTAYTLLRNEFAATLRAIDLTPMEWLVLSICQKHTDIDLRQLSAKLRISPPLTTNLLKKLMEKELVALEEHTLDRRKKKISITTEAQKKLLKSSQHIAALMERVFNDCSQDEIASFDAVSQKIIANTLARKK